MYIRLKGTERRKAYLRYTMKNWLSIIFIIISIINIDILNIFFGLLTLGLRVYIDVSQEEYKMNNESYVIDNGWNGVASKVMVALFMGLVILSISTVHQILNYGEYIMNGKNIYLCMIFLKSYGKAICFIFLQMFLDFLKETKVGKWIIQKGIILKNMILGYSKKPK